MKRVIDVRALHMAGMKAARHRHVRREVLVHRLSIPSLKIITFKIVDDASNHKLNAAAWLQPFAR
jgi:hypothetical protein